MFAPLSASIATDFQFLLYGITLACYGLYLSSPRWHGFLFNGLVFQFLLGLVQLVLSFYRGIVRNHLPSLVYLLIVLAYTVIAGLIGDLSSRGYHILPKVLFFVIPMMLATYALFVVDRSYYQLSAVPSKEGESDILDNN